MKRLNWLKFALPVAFGLAVGVAGLGWVVVYLPQLQTAPLSQKIKGYETSAKPDPEKLATLEKGRLDSESAIRAGLIQGLGGAVLLMGLFFTYRNLQVAEDKLVTDRFSKAADMLGSSSMHTRLGGIYALERIANDSDQDYWQVIEVLSAFVREESPYPPKSKDSEVEGTVESQQPAQALLPKPMEKLEEPLVVESEASQSADPQPTDPKLLTPELPMQWREERYKELFQQKKKPLLAFLRKQVRQERVAMLPSLRTDIEAAMTVIGRRKHRFGKGKRETQPLYLHQTDLRRLKAKEANLSVAALTEAHLEGAWLLGAHLEGTNLNRAYLEGADLRQAHLEKAHLKGAHLEKADLKGAHLEGAHLTGAHLEEADLTRAHLERADLTGAHLEGADLTVAHLEGANLTGAHLKGANLLGARLEKVNLTGAHLEGAFLRGTHLEGADLSQANLKGADMFVTYLKRADLSEANLVGVDLSDVRNLTQKQLNSAFTDEQTKLPRGFHRPKFQLLRLATLLLDLTSISSPTTSPTPPPEPPPASTDTET